MKQVHYHRVKGLSLLLGLLLLLACKKEEPTAMGCAPYEAPIPADTYVFPIQPGTPAWAALTSGDAMRQACQLPAPTLQAISTPGLVTTCLNYPLLRNMLAYTTLQQGVRAQLANFNGFGELQQRSGASATLLERYQLMRPTCLPATQVGDYSFTFSYVEMILAQDEYLQQLSPAQRRALMQEALAKYADKKPLADEVYGLFGLKTAAFVMACIMRAEQYAPFLAATVSDVKLQTFLANAELSNDPKVVDNVVIYAKQF